MKFLILFFAYLPVIFAAIGFIMWIIPKKNTYNKSLNFRQAMGKLFFIVGFILSLVEIGANHRSSFFSPCGKDSVYCYKFLSIPSDTVYVKQDSINTDSAQVLLDTTVKFSFIEEDNMKYLTLNIGNATITGLLDTGCSFDIMLNSKDYYKLVGTGVIKENEFTGSAIATIADGTQLEVHTFTLDDVKIGKYRFNKVFCGYDDKNDITLIGHSLFKGHSITIDNSSKQIILH